MRRIVWAERALDDFDRQIAHIAEENPGSALLVANRVDAAVRNLALHATGRAGRVFGTYEKYVPRSALIIAYELAGLDDLMIIHTSRDWRHEEWPD